MREPEMFTNAQVRILETIARGLGARDKEEAIIHLLEDDLWHDIRFVTRSPDEEQANYHDGECLGCRLIALIKGEK